MIKGISYSQEINAFNSKRQKEQLKIQKNSSLPLKTVSNYSVENLKANYLSFKGNTDLTETANKLSKDNIVPIKRKFHIDPFTAFDNVTAMPSNTLIEGKYYDNAADDIAKVLGPDKNIMLIHKDQFAPEVLVHNFVQNMREGRYSKTGLLNYNTDIFILDPSKISFDKEQENYFTAVIRHIKGLSSSKPEREKVVFMKDFDDFLAAFGNAAKKSEDFFDRATFETFAPNVRLIGLTPESELKPKSTEELLSGEKPKFKVKDLKFVRKLAIDGLSANQTKDFMKREVQFLNEIVRPYKTARFDITHEAIDALVDGCAYKYSGTFPKKAFDILSLMASSLAVTKNNITDGVEITRLNITEGTVKDFYKNHSNLIKYLKFDDSVFSFSENVTTKLDDVGGAYEAKEEMKKIIDFAKNPQKFLKDSDLRSIPKGIIMAGPPGTGKTLLARAVAGEAGVPFATLSAPELLKKYVGEGEEAIREWMGKLREAAIDSGKNVAIGFIDEIDAIGKIRSAAGDGGSEARASILNQFLTELDGFNGKESDVHIVILAATNRDDILDPALKRPGRFDAVVNISLPETMEERLEILEKHVKKLPFEDEAQKAKILKEIAELTPGSSGADLAKLASITKEIVAEKTENKFATYDDMFEGFMQSKMGKKSYIKRPLEERITTAIHEAGHAILVDCLGLSKLSFISNENRANFLGVTISEPIKGNMNFKNVIKLMAINYAGGDTESLFNSMGHDSGVSQDYKQLTNLAETAIKKWGLGVHTPAISFVKADGTPNTYLEDLHKESIKKDLELFTQTAKTISEKLVEFHRDFLKTIYIPKFEQEVKSGNGGNVFSGEVFGAMRQNWIKKTNKVDAYANLKTEINQLIVQAQKRAKVSAEIAPKIIVQKSEEVAIKTSKLKPIALAIAGLTSLSGIAYVNRFKLLNEVSPKQNQVA